MGKSIPFLILIASRSDPRKYPEGFTGEATATYSNGDKYIGSWKDGVSFLTVVVTVALQLRDGEGVFEYVSKGHSEETPITYKGEWSEGKKCGIGKQIYREKVGDEVRDIGTYYGYWQDDKRHGEGVMTYRNKDVYSGEWKNGEKDGKGTYVFEKTGQKYVGLFMQGQMIKGKWIYPNGTFFEGGFDNNKPKGQGCWSFANGNKVDGTYRQIHRVEDVANDIKISWTTKV